MVKAFQGQKQTRADAKSLVFKGSVVPFFLVSCRGTTQQDGRSWAGEEAAAPDGASAAQGLECA